MAAPRDLSGDVAGMRALAHPLRLDLLDLLRAGPKTASEAAAALGELPGNMSWHLRVLAKHGFVEEDPSGIGRRRPWRRVDQGTRWDDEVGSEEEREVGDELTHLVMRRAAANVHAWIDARHGAAPETQHIALLSTSVVHLTTAEAARFGAELEAVLERMRVASDAHGPTDAEVLPLATLVALHPQTRPTVREAAS
jgi:DNA-binding transcriptional ArsR family regulator